MFTPQDLAEYYNSTMNHYRRWWNLDSSLSLHYGIWDVNTKNFDQALLNTNKVLMEKAGIKESDRVLDAGCGVGGAAFMIHEYKKANVTGISLSQKQIDFARKMALKKGITEKIDFQIMDYCHTSFPDASFDVIWACESVSSAQDKSLFIAEAYRLLKKGGRLILSDYFLTEKGQHDAHNLIQKWGKTWSISNFSSISGFEESLKQTGFIKTQFTDYSSQIERSARRMYYAAILGAIPSEIYNLFHPKVSRFAKEHYKSGYYQFKALKENLWRYKVVFSVKD